MTLREYVAQLEEEITDIKETIKEITMGKTFDELTKIDKRTQAVTNPPTPSSSTGQ